MTKRYINSCLPYLYLGGRLYYALCITESLWHAVTFLGTIYKRPYLLTYLLSELYLNLVDTHSITAHLLADIKSTVRPAVIPHLHDFSTLNCSASTMLRTRQRIGDRAFSVAAPRAWNRLPTELKLLRSTDSFRRDLKTFLFHSVYGHQNTD